jgi:biotin transport system substrate-specific component
MSGLTHILNQEISAGKTATRTVMVLLSIGLLCMGAYVRIPLPFTPVPVTLQTFFVFLIAALLGPRYGLMSVAGYLALGAAGLPVFQGYGSGLSYFAGITGGYLAGFCAATLLIGRLFSSGKQFSSAKTILFMGSGALVLYIMGVAWLSLALKISLLKAFYLGAAPFLYAEALKVVSAALIYNKVSAKFQNTL